MKPASEKRTRAWAETRFSNFQLANSGRSRPCRLWYNARCPFRSSCLSVFLHGHRGQCVPNRIVSDRRIFCIGGTACGHADARAALHGASARVGMFASRFPSSQLSKNASFPTVEKRLVLHYTSARSVLTGRRPGPRSGRAGARPSRFTVVRPAPRAGRRGRRPLPPILPRRGPAREVPAPPPARGVRAGPARDFTSERPQREGRNLLRPRFSTLPRLYTANSSIDRFGNETWHFCHK